MLNTNEIVNKLRHMGYSINIESDSIICFDGVDNEKAEDVDLTIAYELDKDLTPTRLAKVINDSGWLSIVDGGMLYALKTI